MADLGTVVVTEDAYDVIKKVTFAWTSVNGGADGGKARKTTTGRYSGAIVRLVTVPGTVGDAPTDDYDVTVEDEDATDVLMGAGLNRDTANTEQVLASSLGYVVHDTLTVNVAAAGDANTGTVYLYIA